MGDQCGIREEGPGAISTQVIDRARIAKARGFSKSSYCIFAASLLAQRKTKFAPCPGMFGPQTGGQIANLSRLIGLPRCA